MNKMIDRSRIEALVRSAVGELKDKSGDPSSLPGAGSGTAMAADPGVLLKPDRGKNLAEPFDPTAMRALLEATPARIAVGRTGTRYKTNTLLRFRADHAAAKDAVMSEVDEKLIDKLGLRRLSSRAESKTHFLLRPDAGRALSDASRAEVQMSFPRGPTVLVIYGDGLSGEAINTHLEAFHNALSAELVRRNIPVGAACFVRNSRVKVMDEICRLTEARACVFVCGERPGLGFADSLSAYFMYRPDSGVPTDADREVISNINPRGLSVAKAGAQVAEAIERVLRDKKSGVVLG